MLTVSDGVYNGTRPDESGSTLVTWVEGEFGGVIGAQEAVPDERAEIVRVLREWSDQRELDLILTTGGTGFAPRDVTPEATREVLEREAPGLAEALRAESLRHTLHGVLSRGVAGIRGRTLIVNLPGSPKAVRESLAVLAPALPHGLELLRDIEGAAERHEPPHRRGGPPQEAS